MRGQTTIDFVIGIVVFLFATVFVLAFVPGMLDPYTGGTEEKRVESNRIGTALAQGLLGDPAEPHVLDVPCTVAFFDPVNNDDSTTNDDWPSDCRYETTNDLNARVGAEGRPAGTGSSLRVRLLAADGPDPEGTRDVACWDRDNATVVPTSHADCGTSDVVLRSGASPPASAAVVVARRGVFLPEDHGVDGTLVVEVW